jgi:hypothetical protein
MSAYLYYRFAPVPDNSITVQRCSLALEEALGDRVARTLSQLDFALAEFQPKIYEGRPWIKLSFAEMKTRLKLPFSRATLCRIFQRLCKRGLVEMTHRFNSNPADQVYWYTINVEAVNALGLVEYKGLVTVPDPEPLQVENSPLQTKTEPLQKEISYI